MSLRRAAILEVSQGAIGSYVHNAVAEGLGKIGVIVALEGSGDSAALTALGAKISQHIAAMNPLALDSSAIAPRGDRARKGGARREERRRQAAACRREDRRIGPEELLQGGLPRRPRSRSTPTMPARRSARSRKRHPRRSRATSATRSAKASRSRPGDFAAEVAAAAKG